MSAKINAYSVLELVEFELDILTESSSVTLEIVQILLFNEMKANLTVVDPLTFTFLPLYCTVSYYYKLMWSRCAIHIYSWQRTSFGLNLDVHINLRVKHV